MRPFLVALALMGLARPSAAAALPDCAGQFETAHAYVQRVEDNGALILTDYRVIHLEGIRLPDGGRDRAGRPFADEALAAIKSIATTPLAIAAPPPRKDRYNRIRAQVFAGSRWLQAELLSRGLARAEIAPDRTECAVELLAVEAKARSSRLGLWALPIYAIRTPEAVRNDVGTFQIVEGKVLSAAVKNGRAFLNFGADWRRDFTAVVDPVDMRNFRATGVDPRSYVGQTIRVRGWVQFHNGPEIEVANPQGIQVMQ